MDREDEEALQVSVFLNRQHIKDERAEEFAWWEGKDRGDRLLDQNAQKQFFKRLDQPNCSGITVVGVNEFPYTDRGKLKGVDRLVEREYWISDPSQTEYVLLHVHFAGKWHDDREQRDRSRVEQANLRHSVTQIQPGQRVWFRKCDDMCAWREESGTQVHIQKVPWSWEQDTKVHPEMHKLLAMGEQCTHYVRTICIAPACAPCEIRGHAFIIAVGRFESEHIPRLPNVYNDAESLKKALER